ncbi:MAG TPA: apolipoprotein N-acyltransferase [Rhodospirillales bacterium]|nr:apolipoprotein N-acyltransferase [Rhodospirillales bacterium]
MATKNFLRRIHGRAISLTGWRRRTLATVLGAMAVTALPPVHFLILLVPAFCGLVWLTDGKPGWRAAFAVGWWFGFGYFAAGLYWISFALLTKPEQFAWMIPFALAGLAGVMAVFPALALLLSSALSSSLRVEGARRILLFAVSWVAFDWIRTWIFTGFPWNLVGTAWVVSDGMLQFSALVGVHGLSLLTVAAAAMPAVLTDGGDHPAFRQRAMPVIAVFTLLGLVWGAGMLRLAGAKEDMVPGVRLRLVQPNIEQKQKWLPHLREKHLLRQLRMSVRPAGQDTVTTAPTHVIWPETAAPFFLADYPRRLAMVAAAAPPDGLVITGAPRMDKSSRVWNSLHAIDPIGRIVGTYDKFHLVPFGEYVPLRRVLNIAKITSGRRDFSAGAGLRTLHLKGLPPVSPLICYEAIFPGRVTDRNDRAHWLLNITNDAWFGLSSGPYQHFATARLRAVEEGLPLVRVANTGISAVIDAYGRTLKRLELGRRGVIDSGLPAHLPGITPYGRNGDWILWGLLAMVAASGLWRYPGKRNLS